MKKFFGKLITLKLKKIKTSISGLIINYNSEWTLMKQNPVDYRIDGYILIRNQNIESFRNGKEEKWKEKIIQLKGIKVKSKEKIPFKDLDTILNFLTKKFGVFQINTNSKKICYLGKLNSISKNQITLKNLTPTAKWKGVIKFKESEIKSIEFDTDYINSLKLVMNQNKIDKKLL